MTYAIFTATPHFSRDTDACIGEHFELAHPYRFETLTLAHKVKERLIAAEEATHDPEYHDSEFDPRWVVIGPNGREVYKKVTAASIAATEFPF